MEDQVQSMESGVESAPVAGEQSQETVTIESAQTETNTGVEQTEVAAQVKDEKDFSTALKAREAQLRQQIEKEYGEKYSSIQQHSEQLKKAARINGWGDDVEAYVAKLDEVERERQIQEEADKLGVDESVIREHLSPLKEKLSTYEKQLQTLQSQENIRKVDAEIASLKTKYPDFEQYEQKVYDMVLKGEAGSLETAYRLASYDDKLAAVAKQKEQEVLANVTKRGEKQVLPSNDGASNTNFSIANASFKDIAELSRRARSGERIEL